MGYCHNLNIIFRTKCKCKGTWGEDSVFESETHFHKWGDYKRLNPMIPKCTFALRVVFMQESQIFKALVGKKKNIKLGF